MDISERMRYNAMQCCIDRCIDMFEGMFIMDLLRKFFKRYFIDAMSAMALGLFSSLIIGLVISQIAKIPGLSFLAQLS